MRRTGRPVLVSDDPTHRAGDGAAAPGHHGDRGGYRRRLRVVGVDAARGFYRDALGLEVRQDVENNGFRWVTLGAPGQALDVVLSQPHGGRSPAEGDALLALVTQGSMQAAIFSADDLESTFDRLVESGAEVLEEPTDQ